MRYRQILEEGAKAYLPMYQGLPILDQDDITNFIDKIEKKFSQGPRDVVLPLAPHLVSQPCHPRTGGSPRP